MSKKEQEVEEEPEVFVEHKQLGVCLYLGEGPNSYSSPHVVVKSKTGLIIRVPRDDVIEVDNVSELVVPSCPHHPNYKAMRRPRSGCRGCIAAYLQAHPEKRTQR